MPLSSIKGPGSITSVKMLYLTDNILSMKTISIPLVGPKNGLILVVSYKIRKSKIRAYIQY